MIRSRNLVDGTRSHSSPSIFNRKYACTTILRQPKWMYFVFVGFADSWLTLYQSLSPFRATFMWSYADHKNCCVISKHDCCTMSYGVWNIVCIYNKEERIKYRALLNSIVYFWRYSHCYFESITVEIDAKQGRIFFISEWQLQMNALQ